MTFDAIVIGGGVVGTSVAYHLVAQGAKTLLIDRGDPGRATAAGAGIISPHTNTRDPDPWYRFAAKAGAYYTALIPDLEAASEAETGFAVCGMLRVAVSRDEWAAFQAAKRLILGRRGSSGRQADLFEISASQASGLFPPLGNVLGAIYDRKAARVDGRRLNRSLTRSAERAGLSRVAGGVDALILDGAAVTGVRVGGETFSAGVVGISGGAWSNAFGEQLGIRIPVEPQRGQIVHLGLKGTDTSHWPMVSAFRGHYMVPWPDNRVVVGATRETGSGFRVHTTGEGVKEVLDEAIRVAPGLKDTEIREVRVGLRPLSEDGLPVLGPVPGVERIFLATGHGPSGLQLGPYSGKVVADMMLGQSPEPELFPFLVERFL